MRNLSMRLWMRFSICSATPPRGIKGIECVQINGFILISLKISHALLGYAQHLRLYVRYFPPIVSINHDSSSNLCNASRASLSKIDAALKMASGSENHSPSSISSGLGLISGLSFKSTRYVERNVLNSFSAENSFLNMAEVITRVSLLRFSLRIGNYNFNSHLFICFPYCTNSRVL